MSLYSKVLKVLDDEKINLTIMELACILYERNSTKKQNFNYLKQLKISADKIAIVINIVECLKDNDKIVIPNYSNYVTIIKSQI